MLLRNEFLNFFKNPYFFVILLRGGGRLKNCKLVRIKMKIYIYVGRKQTYLMARTFHVRLPWTTDLTKICHLGYFFSDP